MNILCAIDLSTHSQPALEAAEKLARRSASSVRLIHVISSMTGTRAEAELLKKKFPNEWADLSRFERQLARAGLKISSVLRKGDVARTILAEAKEIGAEFIVVASHGHGNMLEQIFGSVVDRLLNNSPVPVVVAPVREEDG